MARILAYWNIRGYAEPIRYLLHYVGVEFEDKRYPDRDSWFNEKFQLGLDFPTLPYYIDDDIKLSQSLAILRYLARKYKLAGSNEKERARLDLVEQQIQDLRLSYGFTAFCPASEYETKKAELIKNAPVQFKLLSNFLGDNKWFIGENITYVDFLAYEALDHYWLLIPNLMKDFRNLKDYVERFEQIPALQKYLKSGRHMRWPLYPPMANFGGSGEEPKRE